MTACKTGRGIGALGIIAALAGCAANVYVRDGVTDGDTFYLAPQAIETSDPVVQSWVGYSLIRSTCQLAAGGANPARVSRFDCELRAREMLLDSWREKRIGADRYLDSLVAVGEAGYLEEYVVHYFGTRDWQAPAELDLDAFRDWRRSMLRGHEPQTRLVGYWGYHPKRD